MDSLLCLSQFVCLLLFHFHFEVLCLSPNSSSSSLLCNPYDSHALILLKKSFFIKTTDVLSTPKTESWKEGTDCCFWEGISCDNETGYVIGLHLSHSMLYGSIHSDNPLFMLSHLQYLDLSSNDFNSSRISSRFGHLFNLTHLNLDSSKFSGEVPIEISKLSKLVSLDLSNNGLEINRSTTFDKIFQNLSNLRELDLSYVNLSSVKSSSFKNLSSSLSSLSLFGCELEGEFPDIFHLSKLDFLGLSGGENSELSMDTIAFNKLVQNLTKLRALDMSSVNMSSVEHVYLLNLSSSLSSLKLVYCGLRGEFPSIFIQRSNLQTLDLDGNEDLSGILPMSNWSTLLENLGLSFTQIPIYLEPSFFHNNLKSLKGLRICGCNFVGSNLELFGTLTQLTDLGLSYNNFSGQIPSSFGNLKLLHHLDLSYNNFSRQIPSSFGNLKLLHRLDLSYNNFSGPIPNYFRNLTQLRALSLSKNQLTGPIPSFISEFSNLFVLDLSCNLLNETIPSSLFTLPRLGRLSLNNNQLHGTLNISQIHSNLLHAIDLSYNKLYGPIPSFRSNYLSYIDLRNNMFTGPIPDSVFNSVNLEVLILSSNKLTREVSSVCKSSFLQILDLSNNSFSGFIPPCLVNMSNVVSVLHLGMNNFQGTIPATFPKRCALRYLNLESNQLQGHIPHTIINCENLELINLSNNKIDDAFPYSLGILPHLQALVMHSNKLHGMLKSFNVSYPFPMLRIFDLSNNNFSGALPSKYFDHFEAMIGLDGEEMHYMGSPNHSYDYTVRITFKGLEIELPKIQNALTSIDLSQNKLIRKIPESIGKLKSLIHLNLSHNCFTNNIPPSIGNLSNLESLDLSSNSLSGRIPMELVDLTFLQMFRVSYNRLEGPIPEGKQFNTFDNSSYEGNSGLCGFPLEKCNKVKKVEYESKRKDCEDGFGWKAVTIGYGCGFVFGVGVAYTVFKTRKPDWFVRKIEGNQRPTKSKKRTSKSRRRRN